MVTAKSLVLFIICWVSSRNQRNERRATELISWNELDVIAI